MRIPILTYHSLRAPGNDYHNNDHIALAEDLKTIQGLGYKVTRLADIASFLTKEPYKPENSKLVALSFDDGCDHDYRDFHHPAIGTLESFNTILQQSSKAAPPTATSFVIASPEARNVLDQICIAGRGQWQDDWWLEAHKGGVLSIANHSWDHLHECLPLTAHSGQNKGSFKSVDNWVDADMQILQAELYIRHKLGGHSTGLFAYPYGHWNDFLVEDYFPARSKWFKAAFTTGGEYVTEATNPWLIPRFVCGEHWSSPQGLLDILTG